MSMTPIVKEVNEAVKEDTDIRRIRARYAFFTSKIYAVTPNNVNNKVCVVFLFYLSMVQGIVKEAFEKRREV